MHSLAPIAGITSLTGVDLDAEALQVEVGEGLAELRPAAVGGVLVRARVADRLAHRLDDVAEGGRVGVADAEADHLDPLLRLLLDLALELGEHVGRHRLQALGGVGERHGGPGRLAARASHGLSDPVRDRRRHQPDRRRRARRRRRHRLRAPRDPEHLEQRHLVPGPGRPRHGLAGRAAAGASRRRRRGSTCGWPPEPWPRCSAIYALTSVVVDEPELAAVTLCYALAVVVISWLAASWADVACALIAAVVGPLFEIGGRSPSTSPSTPASPIPSRGVPLLAARAAISAAGVRRRPHRRDAGAAAQPAPSALVQARERPEQLGGRAHPRRPAPPSRSAARRGRR